MTLSQWFTVMMWKWKPLSHDWLFVTPLTIVHGILQARYGSGKPFPSPGDLPNPGIEPNLPIALSAEPPGKDKNIGVRVAYPFSSRSSQPRNRTRVSCMVSGFFTNWATYDTKSTNENEKRWLMGHHQIKNNCASKGTIKKMKKDGLPW